MIERREPDRAIISAVVKLGGSCLEDLSGEWWDDLACCARTHRLVLVHGWSKPLKRLHPRYRRPTAILRDRYGNQSRWTTPEVIRDIVTVSEAVCAAITGRLEPRGVTVSRLVGSDGLLQAGPGERWYWRDKHLVEIDNLVGPISDVDPAPLLSRGLDRPHSYLVTPLARDEAGRVVNTDADRAAAAVAGAAAATSLILVTDVPYLLMEGEPVHHITAKAAEDFRDRAATGGMRKKLRAAVEALNQGVERVVIGSALISDLLDERTGTVITNTDTPIRIRQSSGIVRP